MEDSTYSLGGGGSSEGDEVLEQRSWPAPAAFRRLPGPFRRPPPRGVVLCAAALLVGLAGGYAACALHAGKATAPPARSRAAVTPTVPLWLISGFPLSQSGPVCSEQTGRELQLGVQVTNVSTAALTMRRVDVVLPVGGLKLTSQAWGTCGQLPVGEPPDNVVPARGSTWFTVTFRVLIRCPQPLPVQFKVDYVQLGRPAAVTLPGFEDLGPVPYAHCPTSSPAQP